jgi:hypothetical protein
MSVSNFSEKNYVYLHLILEMQIFQHITWTPIPLDLMPNDHIMWAIVIVPCVCVCDLEVYHHR